MGVHAAQFTVFEKDGYFGIKDQSGTVTVPAVYEKLGWSDGSTDITNGVIGYRENKLWGLITVKNKPLTSQKFYTLEPISSHLFKASIKGKFSNYLFHGILDEKGNTLISFNYFSIAPLGINWLVSEFNGRSQRFGVVSFENTVIVPLKYRGIDNEKSLLFATAMTGKIDLFNERGTTIELGVDSLKFAQGWRVYRDGYAGFLSARGETIYPFEYKDIDIRDEKMIPITFPEWKVFRNDSIQLTWACDSIDVGRNGLLVAHLNGAQHLLLSNSEILKSHDLQLKEFYQNQLIVQNSKTRKWSVLSEKGTRLLGGYDSILGLNGHYLALENNGWKIFDQQGIQKNRFDLEKVLAGIGEEMIGCRNANWGFYHPKAMNDVAFKYDSIVPTSHGYLVKYLNLWGLMDVNRKWSIRPEFEEMQVRSDIIFGRRGAAYAIFWNETLIHKSVFRPLEMLGNYILIQGDEQRYGLLNLHGEFIFYPYYDSIQWHKSHFVLEREGGIALMKEDGKLVLQPEESYQRVSGYGEGYFLVQKDNRWGYVDDRGRLRISNRYEGGTPFQEERAAVLLRGKWGFIDKQEKIQIQPYYEMVTPFLKGKSIVSLSDKFGLIGTSGEEVLEVKWKSIHRLPTGNYLVRDFSDRMGLVDEDGSFILRPAYAHLEDFGGRILVVKNDKWGILDYSGQEVIKVNHEEVKVTGNYTMVRD